MLILTLLVCLLSLHNGRASLVLNTTTSDLQPEESSKREAFSMVYNVNDELVPVSLDNSDWHVPNKPQAEPEEKTTYSTELPSIDHQFNVHEFLSKLPTYENGRPGDTFQAKLYDEQLYECVLLPKQKKYNHKEHEHITEGKVHQLYDIDMDQVQRKVVVPAPVRHKLKDFGNFLYVDDSNRPAHHSLPERPVKKKLSNKARKSRKEIDDLFSKLKQSLDKLMCYQNEECYGGSLGGDNEKLDQFIRHIRMSKKVFDLLEKNRKHLSFLEQDWSDKPDSAEDLAIAGAQPVQLGPMLYSDSNVQPIAMKVHRKSVPTKYYTASQQQHNIPLPAAIDILATATPNRRKLMPARYGQTGGGGLIDSIGKNKLANKLGKHLISGLFGGNASPGQLLVSRDSSLSSRPTWRRTAPRTVGSTATSLSGSPSMDAHSDMFKVGWPNKPVLVIKEYEEYND